jgi:hypothetical protein
LDCSLGGVCAAQKCECDPQFTGARCDILHLRGKTKLNNGIHENGADANHTWGGHALKDNSRAGGKWVGFFSYLAGDCGLGSWGSSSMIISATADAPDGPFDMQTAIPVLGIEAHNAMISKHPNGSYFLFHIGCGTTRNRTVGCTPHTFKPCGGWNESNQFLLPNGSFPAGYLEPEPATTHISESLHGPWRPAPNVPTVNNPCPYFFDNGTTLLFDRNTVRWASSVDYTGTWQQRTTIVDIPFINGSSWNNGSSANGTDRPEDPGVWRDKRGNFHMLFNANSGHVTCPSGKPCGGHTWSTNGLDWALPTIPAFGTVIHYEDNTTIDWGYVERPQVAQDTDGTLLTLYLGQSQLRYHDAHSLAIMFCQKGDADCVTTIQ